jgi:hypothetical protein
MQTFEPCSPHFQLHPHLLICSTPLHGGRHNYSQFEIVWEVILGRYPPTANRTSTTTTTKTTTTTTTTTITTTIVTTTMRNLTSLPSERNILLTEATRSLTLVKNRVRRRRPIKNEAVLSLNSSNQLNLVKTNSN